MEIRFLGPFDVVDADASDLGRRWKAASAPRDPRSERRRGRPGRAADRRAVARRPSRLRAEHAPGVRLATAEGAASHQPPGGSDSVRARGLPPRRLEDAIDADRFRGLVEEGERQARAGNAEHAASTSCARRSRCGAGRRWPTSPTSRSLRPRSLASTSCGSPRSKPESTPTFDVDVMRPSSPSWRRSSTSSRTERAFAASSCSRSTARADRATRSRSTRTHGRRSTRTSASSRRPSSASSSGRSSARASLGTPERPWRRSMKPIGPARRRTWAVAVVSRRQQPLRSLRRDPPSPDARLGCRSRRPQLRRGRGPGDERESSTTSSSVTIQARSPQATARSGSGTSATAPSRRSTATRARRSFPRARSGPSTSPSRTTRFGSRTRPISRRSRRRGAGRSCVSGLAGGGVDVDQVGPPRTPDEMSTFVASDGRDGMGGEREQPHRGQARPGTGRILMRVAGLASAGSRAGDGAVWVPEPKEDLVVRLNIRTGRVEARIPVSGSPSRVAVGEGGVWVVTTGVHSGVWRIDPKNNETVAVIPVPPKARRVATGSGYVWVTSGRDEAEKARRRGVLSKIDPQHEQHRRDDRARFPAGRRRRRERPRVGRDRSSLGSGLRPGWTIHASPAPSQQGLLVDRDADCARVGSRPGMGRDPGSDVSR